MSDTTTVMPTDPAAARVAGYVAQVRAEFGDLPPEEVADLTYGMEGDLGELAAESGPDLRARLGTPQAYAAELRTAAGLPPRPARNRGRRGAVTEEIVSLTQRQGDTVLKSWPWLRDLRGAWWLARGLMVGVVFGHWLGSSWPVSIPLTLAALVGSVWLGLRTQRQKVPWWPLALLNAAAAVLLPLAFLSVLFSSRTGGYVETIIEERPPSSGVFVNGATVGNLYAYDATGERLDRVRIFDQTGRQVVLGGEHAQGMTGWSGDDSANPTFYLPDGEPRRAESFPTDWFGRSPWERITGWTPPMSIVPLAVPAASPSAATSPTDSPPTSDSTTSPTSVSTASPTSSTSTSTASPTSSASRSTSPTSSTTPRSTATSTG